MKRLACVAVSASLFGCAATLDAAATATTDLASPLPPEALYRNVVTAMRTCYSVPTIRVEGDYFPEARAGTLRLIWGNSVGVIEWLRIDIAAAPAGSSLRAVHRVAQDRFPAALEAWTRGDASECPYR